MKEFLIRHFQSEGFKKRLVNWYLPAFKMGLAWGYNKILGYLESKQFTKIYEGADKVLEDKTLTQPEEKPATSAPATDVVMQYEDAVAILKPYLIGHIPQILGTCVSHSIKNASRFAVKIAFGRDIDLAEGDIYIDRATKNFGIDGGMYPDLAIPRVAEKGVAIRDVVPTANNIEELALITRDNYPDNDVAPFRVKLLKDKEIVPCYRNFDALWSMITNEYKTRGIRPFQFSMTSYAGWWGTDLPTATGAILGSHSVVGVVLPFMYGNKRAFFAIDSAYRNGLVWRVGAGIRIVTEDTWNGLGDSARKLEFVPQIEAKLAKAVPVPPPSIVVSAPAKKGDTGEAVIAIQKALMSLGYDIPAISQGISDYGYYGAQTATAVLAWHNDNWQKFYALNAYWTQANLANLKGESFGNLSVQVISGQL